MNNVTRISLVLSCLAGACVAESGQSVSGAEAALDLVCPDIEAVLRDGVRTTDEQLEVICADACLHHCPLWAGRIEIGEFVETLDERGRRVTAIQCECGSAELAEPEPEVVPLEGFARAEDVPPPDPVIVEYEWVGNVTVPPSLHVCYWQLGAVVQGEDGRWDRVMLDRHVTSTIGAWNAADALRYCEDLAPPLSIEDVSLGKQWFITRVEGTGRACARDRLGKVVSGTPASGAD